MRRFSSSALLCLLFGAGCNQLPPDAPQFSFEFTETIRANASFCFLDDNRGVSPAPPGFSRNGGCVRFTVLRPDGVPVAGGTTPAQLAASSCSIKTDQSGLKGNRELGLLLRTEEFENPLDPEKKVAPLFADNEGLQVRVELFQDANRQAQALSPVFQAKANEDDPARALLFVDENRASCLPLREDDIAGTAESVSLQDARAFHSATPVVGDEGRQGVILAGGAPQVLSNTEPNAQTLPSGRVELLDLETMRFSALGDLASPRAGHEAVSVEVNGSPRVVLVGGTTKSTLVNNRGRVTGLVRNPLSVMQPATNDRFDQGETGAGAEILVVDPANFEFSSIEVNDAPGRFAPAVAAVGDKVLVFGGIATTPGQNCDAHPQVAALDNLLCRGAFAIDAATGAVEALPDMSAPRIGAQAQVFVNGDGSSTVIVWGGSFAGTALADVYDVAVDGTITARGAINDNAIAAGLEAKLHRGFFSLTALPGRANEFFVFGGEVMAPEATGSIINTSGNPAQTPNVAARLIFDPVAGTVNAVESNTPGAIRPSEANDAGLFFTLNAENLSLDELDLADEEIVPAGDLGATFDNLGERYFFSNAVADTGRLLVDGTSRVVILGGARGELFPQDTVFEYTLSADGTVETLVQLGANEAAGSRHLLRRLVGSRLVTIPGLGVSADVAVLTGGAFGLPVPATDDPLNPDDDDVFFFNDLIGENVAGINQVRRDVSYFSLTSPLAADAIADACSAGAAIVESAACGFANKELEKTRKDAAKFLFCEAEVCAAP